MPLPRRNKKPARKPKPQAAVGSSSNNAGHSDTALLQARAEALTQGLNLVPTESTDARPTNQPQRMLGPVLPVMNNPSTTPPDIPSLLLPPGPSDAEKRVLATKMLTELYQANPSLATEPVNVDNAPTDFDLDHPQTPEQSLRASLYKMAERVNIECPDVTPQRDDEFDEDFLERIKPGFPKITLHESLRLLHSNIRWQFYYDPRKEVGPNLPCNCNCHVFGPPDELDQPSADHAQLEAKDDKEEDDKEEEDKEKDDKEKDDKEEGDKNEADLAEQLDRALLLNDETADEEANGSRPADLKPLPFDADEDDIARSLYARYMEDRFDRALFRRDCVTNPFVVPCVCARTNEVTPDLPAQLCSAGWMLDKGYADFREHYPCTHASCHMARDFMDIWDR